ncbi:GNAT family N-acetyltransferase (plasmid) [Nitratidesulfovibrio vulgaris]|nr:GNAT family N-acetyltransferase [Nitratidesulfovibrio vulgaris]WCB48104.1 GNAT family N-acetyltransferase [Nitratidesulfovibrio vulgaris]
MQHTKVLTIYDKAGKLTTPLARVLVQRIADNHCDAANKDVVLKLRYWEIGRRSRFHSGEFLACYSSFCNTVSLVSQSFYGSGGVFIDPEYLRGHRLGTYLLNEIVLWARQWPEAQVAQIELCHLQGLDEDNRKRRNRLYEQFGITFDYTDEHCCRGVSHPMLASQLVPVSRWQENIREEALLDTLAALTSSPPPTAASRGELLGR